MAVFEVTRDYLGKFMDTQIEKNHELKDFREDLVDMLSNWITRSSVFIYKLSLV